jgi:hypothetical protein
MNEDSGFTFIETLFTLTLVLLISVAVFNAFFTVLRHNGSALSEIKKAYILLSFDQKLRGEIEKTYIPYWENSKTYADELCENIIAGQRAEQVAVTGARVILKNGKGQGIEVSYRLINGETEYKTVCLFSSAGDAVDRKGDAFQY